MFGFSPWILVGALAGGIALAGGGYFKGDADAANRYQLKIATMQADAEKNVQKIRDANIAQANAAVATLESTNAEARIVFRTITHSVDKVVDRPVYLNTCFDADGLQLVNAALAGVAAAGAPPGDPHNLVPPAIAPH